MTELSQLIKTAKDRFGDQPFLIGPDRTITFTQLENEVERTSRALKAQDVGQNERVGFYTPNSIEMAVTILALIHSGATACLMSVRLPSVMIRAIADQLSLEIIISDRPINLGDGCQNVLLTDLSNSTDSAAAKVLESKRPEANSLATIIFSSGSTSTPKAIGHTLDNHYYNALGSNENIPFEPGDRWLLSLPLYHVGGLSLIFRSLTGGGAIVVSGSKFGLADQIKTNSITHLSLVNSQLRELLKLDEPDRWHRSLKAAIIGGAPQNLNLLNRARKAGLPIATTYGLTEMASQVTCSKPTTTTDSTNSSGHLLNYRDLEISTAGEILVKGVCLSEGILDKGRLIRPIDADGWYHTRDRGEMTGDGNLIVLGRLDSMFISGGENIFPEQIESALHKISWIDEVIVVPLADKKFGERPVAFVRCDPHPPVPLKELAKRLVDSLPGFMIPIRFFPWPRTLESTGLKPSRSRLKQIAKEFYQAES